VSAVARVLRAEVAAAVVRREAMAAVAAQVAAVRPAMEG